MTEREDHFLEHLRAELALPSQAEAKPLVKSVLEALRKTLSRQNAEAVCSRLPEFLKNYFNGNGGEEKEVNVEHLDELVVLVMEKDRNDKTSLFKSEIQTLAVILYTLRNVFARIDPRNTSGINYPFYHEVTEASAALE